MAKQFINPHQHSDASLDGAATIKQIVARNKELGATHVAITEHGNMNTAMTLYKECHKQGLKPIVGIEVYLKPPFESYIRERATVRFKDVEDIEKRQKKVDKAVREAYTHLTIHFKDEIAYQYFCRLTAKMESRAIVRWGDRKPVCTIEELQEISEHITIGSGCLLSVVNYWLLPERNAGVANPALAEQAYQIIRNIVGPDDFYAEIFPHKLNKDWKPPVFEYKDAEGRKFKSPKIVEPGKEVPIEPSPFFPDGDKQKRCNQFILEMATKYQDKILISLDAHFARPEQKVIQDAKLGHGTGRWRNTNSYHVMSTDECVPILKETLGVTDETINNWIENSYEYARKFDNFRITTCDDRWVINDPPADFMAQLKAQIDRFGRMDWKDQEMIQRLQKEIKVLFFNPKINLYDYFYKVQKMADYCANNHILMNVRGSGAGCLLLYLLGVSAVNPLEYGLSFERFLTEGRIEANTLPDADLDISHQDLFFQWLEKEYGDAFCRISTEQMLKLKSSIKDSERHHFGKVREKTETLTKKLPPTPQGVDDQEFVFGYEDDNGNHVPGIFDTNKELQKYAEDNPEIWETVKEMMGVARQKGTHACGFVIADKPVENYCPITFNGDTKVTGFNPKSTEACGLIKFDGLGVNTLKDIQGCIDSIKERTGEVVDPWNLPYDEKCFVEFAKGQTETVFQFDSTTIIPILKRVKPLSISDLAATTALGRPGTLDAPYGDGRTLAQVFMDRCAGEQVEYIHPDLEPIFKETQGIQLYQEQTIQVFKTFAGYTNAQSETVRRGIGKKIKEVLESCMEDLRQGCLSKGWTNDQVDLLIKQIMASARYSFNKSHAVSYAKVAYACMWLKVNHPLDWWKATLSNADKDEVANKFWRYVKDIVQAPDINISTNEYHISGNKLIAPLSIIKGVGEKSFQALVENKPYESLEQFIATHMRKRFAHEPRSAVHSGVVKKLIAAGVMDSFFEQNACLEDKISKFNQIKAEIRQEKVDPVPESLLSISAFDQYMFKKQVLSIYSADLRELILPHLLGRGVTVEETSQGNIWRLKGDIIHCWPKLKQIEDFAWSPDFDGDYYFLGFVVEERVFRYSKNNCKQATELTIDLNGHFHKQVYWPPYTEDKEAESIAPSGFKNLPVLLCYNVYKGKVRFKSAEAAISKDQLEKYTTL